MLASLVLVAAHAAFAGHVDAKLLDSFEAALAAQDSATAVLTEWCAARGIADPAKIIAQPVEGDDALPAPDLAQTLGVSDEAPLGYRHVRLSCGGKTLSEAHNWYVPARLTAAMNETLATTHTPFGTVAAPLGFRRERLGSVRARLAGCPADTVLAQRALLRLPSGEVLALLTECYTSAILAAPAKR